MNRACILALLFAASLLGCSNDDLVLLLTDVPAGIERLEIVASLDGRSLQRAYTNGLSSSVVLALPEGSQGKVTAVLNGLDSRGCRTATGEVQVSYQPGGSRPTVVPVSLTTLPSPECPLTVQLSGSGEVTSMPAGIACSAKNPAVGCRAYLRDGVQVQLSAMPQPSTYVTWSQACTGVGGCVVTMNGQVTVGATFMPTARCTQPSCWSRDAPASSISNLQFLNTIWGTSADNIWASSRLGAFYHYDGKIWSTAPYPDININIRGIWGSGPDDIWAVGNSIILHYDGIKWSITSRGTFSSYLTSIHGTSRTDIWAVGEKSNNNDNETPLILHFNGSKWSEAKRPTQSLYAVLSLRPNLAWAAGSAGTLLKWDGLSWEAATGVPMGLMNTLRSLHGFSESSVWAVGYDTILHFDGSKWNVDANSTLTKSQEITGLWGTSDGNLWAVGYSGLILHRTDSGWAVDTFNSTEPCNLSVPGPCNLAGVWGASPQDIWAVGGESSFDGGVFYRYVPR